MLLLGHTGVTLGAALLARVVIRAATGLRRAASLKRRGAFCSGCAAKDPAGPGSNPGHFDPRAAATAAFDFDYRFVVAGSLLPDIIDKPVGIYLLGDVFSNGRIFSHTLLVATAMVLAGIYLYSRNQNRWLISLAFGSLFHLLEDQMWLNPRTFLWPAYGWTFAKGDTVSWLQRILQELQTDPGRIVPEMAGMIVLAGLAVLLLRRRKLSAFIRKGSLVN